MSEHSVGDSQVQSHIELIPDYGEACGMMVVEGRRTGEAGSNKFKVLYTSTISTHSSLRHQNRSNSVGGSLWERRDLTGLESPSVFFLQRTRPALMLWLKWQHTHPERALPRERSKAQRMRWFLCGCGSAGTCWCQSHLRTGGNPGDVVAPDRSGVLVLLPWCGQTILAKEKRSERETERKRERRQCERITNSYHIGNARWSFLEKLGSWRV